MNTTDQYLTPKDANPDIRSDCPEVVREYCKLATQKQLSPAETDRMLAILQDAESDGWLDFWINEADHFIAHELDQTHHASIRDFENQQAYLREHLENSITKDTYAGLFREIECRIRLAFKELQQHLKNRGFDPGPIDGVLGMRTKQAIVAFQTASKLDPNGLPDETTREALGLN
jgi:Putative peptidoglycan binding domain